jgi:PAS domain S-box-containing protein
MPATDPRGELVLVLAPTGRDGRLIAEELVRHDFVAMTCSTLDQLCNEIEAGTGMAVMAEEALPPAGLTGLVQVLERQPPWSDLPLLVLTGKGTPSAGSLRRFQVLEPVANVTQLERPIQTRTLVSAVRSALRARRRQYDVRAHLAERERAQEGLRRSEERYRVLVTASSDVVYRMSADWTELFPIDGRELVESNVEPIRGWMEKNLPVFEHARVTKAIQTAIRDKTVFEFEHQVIRPDGTVGWTYSRAAPILDDRGEVVEWFGTARDVSERKGAEQELARLAETLGLAMATADLGTWEWYPDTDEMVLSRRAAEIYGVDQPGPHHRETLRALLHPDDREPARVAAETATTQRTDYDIEYRLAGDGREAVWVAVRGRGVYDEAGRLVRLLGVVQDVTARKRAEVALRESEARYRTLFTSMDEGFCVIEVLFDPADPGRAVDYRFLEVNPAFEAQSGMREVIGRRMLEFVPSIESHWLANYGRVALTGEPIRFANEYKTLYRWFDVYAFRVGEPDRHRVAVLFTDITARRRAEEERERLVEQLRDADRKKDQFLALLAHELRNPLAPIRNGLQVIRLSEERDARERAQAMMDRQLGHMVRLIDDLLDVSRISRNKMELRRSRLLLSDVVSNAVETVRPAIDDAGHELTVLLPDEPLYLDADLTRLAQVFGNLLGNSAKYTPPGGRIRLAAVEVNGHAEVTVSDNGIGIPSTSLPAIFDMFSQVDRSIERSTGGLGIGLALVKGLVEMHGGTVTVASSGPGQGSTFTVRLPLLSVTPSTEPPIWNGVVPAVDVGRRVLVVDDNRDAAESMAEMLKLLGYSVAVAHDGLQAVEAADAVRPDVVLMDVGMPRMNGLDATRRIRERPWGRDAVIVALTGWGQEGDRVRSKEAGCDGHLVKPVNLPDLQSLLGQLV